MENNAYETPEDKVAPPVASTYALVIAACISPFILHGLLWAAYSNFRTISAEFQDEALAGLGVAFMLILPALTVFSILFLKRIEKQGAIVAVAWIGYWILVNSSCGVYSAAVSKAFSSMKQGQELKENGR